MKSVAIVLVLLPLAASAATITVNTRADSRRAGNRACMLREAIANVNAASDTTKGDCTAGSGTGDTIIFSLTLPATITLRRQLSLSRDVTITGPGPDLLASDGRHARRVVHVTAGGTSISDLTIQNGLARYPHAQGGGILVDNGAALALTNCTLSGNAANSTRRGSGIGGGIAVYGTAVLTNCTLSNNTATGGPGYLSSFGGRAGAIGIAERASATLTNCTFSGNTADHYGGGVLNSGTTTLTQCTVTGNSARLGSGVLNTGTSPAIDAGDDAVTGPPDNLTTDQRGLPRLSGVHVDIGAYEVQ